MRLIYPQIALAALLVCGSWAASAQTILTTGDIAIIGYNMDNADLVKFVALVDIAAGTQIKFTDNGWNGTALTTNEGTDTWTAATNYTKGTVLTHNAVNMALSTSGDQVFAYQGAATAPTFIFGLSTKSWVSGSISGSTSRKPAALTNGSTALAFSTERDNGKYNVVTNSGDKATLLTAIANASNWATTDTRISTFPTWSFTVGGGTSEPANQPTALVFSNITSYKYNVSFTAASPAPSGYLVLRAVNDFPNYDPVDGNTYALGNTIGNAKVVSVGTATAFLQESVVADMAYGYKVYAYNGTNSATNYKQSSPLENMVVSAANQIGTYYNNISPANATFISDLQTKIRSPYLKVSYDQYDETMMTHFAVNDTSNAQKVAACVYSGEKYSYTPPFAWYTATPFSREHTWCVSWMPSNATSSYNEYCDQHHLFPTNQNNANAVRSNHPLGVVASPISTYLAGKYGYDIDGNTVYEPMDKHKGDAARALLYMALRYNGINGFNWTFNSLNNTILPALGEDTQNLQTLLQWHSQDPPDNYEIARNDYIQSIQQNRNPLIDHPEWANYINFNDLSWIQNPGKIANDNNIFSENGVAIWPNPMQDIGYVYVEATAEENAQLSIFDIMGRPIYTRNITLQAGINATQLETDLLPAGNYWLNIQTANRQVTKQFVVIGK
jgi:endonuclease I